MILKTKRYSQNRPEPIISKFHVRFEGIIEKLTFFVVGHCDCSREWWCGLCFYIFMEEHPLCQNTPAVYRPSQPAELLLYRLLSDYFHSFEQVYDVRFVREYGIYRPVISDVVRAYLKCGDLNIGIHSCTLYQLSLRVPAQAVTPKRLFSLVSYCGKTFSTHCYIASMSSVFRLSCGNTSSIIVSCFSDSVPVPQRAFEHSCEPFPSLRMASSVLYWLFRPQGNTVRLITNL